MRLTSEIPSWAFSLTRQAALAAGFGLGWLLLSSSAASALGDLPGTPAPPASPISAPAAASPIGLPTVPMAQHAAAGAVGAAASALGSGLQSAPPLADPLLTGPLESLAPVVDDTAAGLALIVRSGGETVIAVVTDPAGLSDQLVLPTGPSAVPEASAQPQAAAETPVSDAVPEDAPTLGTPAPVQVENAPGIPSPQGPVPGAADYPPGAYAGAPSPAPDGPPPAPLPAAPPAGSGGADRLHGASPASAILAGSGLAPALLVTRRRRPVHDPAPSSRTFDPGSTPG